MYISLFYRVFFFPSFFLRMCRALEAFTTGGGRILARAEGPAHAHIEDKSGG